VHGPRCIAVAVELLDDPDSRVCLAALVALLDRGFGRPAAVITSPDGTSPVGMHHVVAQFISTQLIAELEQRGHQPPAIDGHAEPVPQDLLSAPPPLE
jgi:hypothetical protein